MLLDNIIEQAKQLEKEKIEKPEEEKIPFKFTDELEITVSKTKQKDNK